jgi:predicted ester cyclase
MFHQRHVHVCHHLIYHASGNDDITAGACPLTGGPL